MMFNKLTSPKFIGVDSEAGLATIAQVNRFRNYKIDLITLGPLVSNSLHEKMKYFSSLRYYIEADSNIFKVFFPLNYVREEEYNVLEELIKFSREVFPNSRIVLRIIADKYSSWAKLLELVPSGIDYIELDFATPHILALIQPRNYGKLVCEFTKDLASISSYPVIVRLPLFFTEIPEVIKELHKVIEYLIFTSTYLAFHSNFLKERYEIYRIPCRSSSINDLAVSLLRPWEQSIKIGVSTEVCSINEVNKLFSLGFSIVELGLSLLYYNLRINENIKVYTLPKPIEKVVEEHKKYAPIIIDELCNKCNGQYLCVRLCPEGILKIGKNGLPYAFNECSGCLLCTTVCKRNAIRLGVQIKLD